MFGIEQKISHYKFILEGEGISKFYAFLGCKKFVLVSSEICEIIINQSSKKYLNELLND